MANGTVRKLVSDRGFGFIKTDQGKDVFFHCSQFVGDGGFDTLREGDSVSFDVEQGDKGPRAIRVNRA